MKILSVNLQNFASYKNLDFNFQNQGLTLIQGPTGAGKSTLFDAVPWVLFGRTAKGGTVDEIRSWNNTEPTIGKLLLDLDNSKWEIVRIRGKSNDLYFRPEGSEDLSRGKDITDTQRLLNQKLGMDFDLYLAGAYYHEFSQTAEFFTTTAKNRRSICEQLVDLTLATKLKANLKTYVSDLESKKRELDQQILTLDSNVSTLLRIQESEKNKHRTWTEAHAATLSNLESRMVKWEEQKETTILALRRKEKQFTAVGKDIPCPTCGAAMKHQQHNPYTSQIETESRRENPYIEQLLSANKETNPYSEAVADYSSEIAAKLERSASLKDSLLVIEYNINEGKELDEVINTYRSVSITNTISFVEQQTNKLLTDFFDSEIRVDFKVESADKLDVTIYKDGNTASFTQLSKGQRCLLKLCFGISVMQAVQNHHGISFDQIFIDEGLSGLDEQKKLKAVHMLENLTRNYGSIYFVEHSDSVQAMVNNKYSVELTPEGSQIGQA